MPLSAQQLAAQKNLSYVLAEKLAQRILAGKYAPGSILPGEMELGEQFGVSRTAVREAVKTLTAKGMVLPRPRIGTRVMPQSNWNFLDQELLSWWMTEDNFHQVIDHFLVMRSSLEPQACLLAATLGTAEQKAQLNALKNGEISGLVVQNPFGIGYASVIAAARTVLQAGNEAEVNTGYVWVTKENMESESIRKMLYE